MAIADQDIAMIMTNMEPEIVQIDTYIAIYDDTLLQ